MVSYKVGWISLDLKVSLVCKILKRQAELDYWMIILELTRLKSISE